MQLHHIRLSSNAKRVQRVGRGGKRGTTSGRGQKGQKSRAGRKMLPRFRDLISRLPKRRGFRNKPIDEKVIAIPLLSLQKFSGEIGIAFLKKHRLVPGRYRGAVKVIGSAPLVKPLVLIGLQASQGAKTAIEKAGGKIQ